MRFQYILPVFMLFQSVLWAGTTPVTVDGIDVRVRDNTVDLLVKTSGQPSYQVAFSRSDQLKLRIDDATGYDFIRSTNPLWKQVPFYNISLAQFYNNLYLTIGTENRKNLRFSHSVVPEGILLTFQSELFQFSHPKVIENLREDSEDRLLAEKNKETVDKNYLEKLNLAMNQEDLHRAKNLFSELPDTDELPVEMVKNLAKFFESHGMYKASEKLWMQYYTTQVNSGEVNYSDAIPSSQMERPQSTKQNIIGGEPLAFIAENKWSLALFFILSLITSSGYFWYSSRQSSQEEDISGETSGDFLTTLQHSMETDTRKGTKYSDDIQTQKNDNPRKNFSGKLPTTPINSAPNSQSPSDNESGKQAGRKRREADRLRRLGLSTDMIARELKLSRGEVELLLKITEESHSSTKANQVIKESITRKTPEEIARQLQISVEEAKIMRMRQGRG